MAPKKRFSRSYFVAKSASGFAGIAVSNFISGSNILHAKETAEHPIGRPPGSFNSEVEKLPEERSYAYHKKLSLDPIHGPADVTSAQIDEANKRGMKVFSKVDTFASLHKL